MSLSRTVSDILSFFPKVELAFAYGSAALLQHGRERGKMLDLVFVVKDSQKWHTDNININSSHYSFLKYFGPSTIVKFQRQPAGIYYNTLIHINKSQVIKYGVMSIDDFYKDLNEWEWLYVSGRLHKPVTRLMNTTSFETEITNSLNYNLKSAVLCSLLLLNKTHVTEWELFVTITSLSYMGDFRMIIGEDKNKVKNIVIPALNEFRKLYGPILHHYLCPYNNSLYEVKIPLSVEPHMDMLPKKVQEYLIKGMSLSQAITSVVTTSSRRQAIKGVVTAGLVKSVTYSSHKMMKMFNSLIK